MRRITDYCRYTEARESPGQLRILICRRCSYLVQGPFEVEKDELNELVK